MESFPTWLKWDEAWTPEQAAQNFDWGPAWKDPAFRALWLLINAYKTVVDLGCGGARLAYGCHARYVGVDSSRVNLEVAQRNLATHRHPGQLVRAELSRTPFGPKAFDVAVLRHVLEHNPVPHAAAILREAERVAAVVVVNFFLPPRPGVAIERRDWDGFYEITHSREIVRGYGQVEFSKPEHVVCGDEIWVRANHGAGSPGGGLGS